MSPCRRACSPSPPTPSRGPRPRPPPAWAGPWPGRPARPPPGPGGRDQPVTPALGAVMVRRWRRRWRRAGRAPTAGTRPLASRGSGGARHPVDAAATQAPGLRARRGAEGGGLGLFLFAFSVCFFFFLNQSWLCRRGWEAGCSPRGDGRGGGAAVGGRERGYQQVPFPWLPPAQPPSGNSWAFLCQLLLGSLASSPSTPVRSGRAHDRGHASRARVRACAYGLVLLHRVSEDAG